MNGATEISLDGQTASKYILILTSKNKFSFTLFFQESSGSKFGTAMLGKFAKRKGKLILAGQYKKFMLLLLEFAPFG